MTLLRKLTDEVKVYNVQSEESSSTHTLRLLQKVHAVEGKDYCIETGVNCGGKTKPLTNYLITPSVFKKLLIRSKNTDKYAEYFLILEKSVYCYHLYQLDINAEEGGFLGIKTDTRRKRQQCKRRPS
jgi:hypothetical protein